MRPEIEEYNFDWMMGGILNAASNLANGSAKETEMAYRYMPYYRDVAKTFINSGKVGIQTLKMYSHYFEDILTAHEQGKKIAASTFCLSPAIFYAMDVVPICTEILTALGGIVWKRGMFDYLDHSCQVGLPETSCSSQRGALGAYFAGKAEEIDFVICDTPGVCDTNANAFSFAASYLNKPFYQLNFPQILGDERSQQYHVDDYREMVRFIEEQTGGKMDYDRLAQVLEEVDRQDELVKDIEDMFALRGHAKIKIHNVGPTVSH